MMAPVPRSARGLTPKIRPQNREPRCALLGAVRSARMGNDIGKGATNRMAIAAMSNVTSVEKKELLTMKKIQ